MTEESARLEPIADQRAPLDWYEVAVAEWEGGANTLLAYAGWDAFKEAFCRGWDARAVALHPETALAGPTDESRTPEPTPQSVAEARRLVLEDAQNYPGFTALVDALIESVRVETDAIAVRDTSYLDGFVAATEIERERHRALVAAARECLDAVTREVKAGERWTPGFARPLRAALEALAETSELQEGSPR